MTISIHKNGSLFTVSALGNTTSDGVLKTALTELVNRLYKDRARLCGLGDGDLTDEAKARRDQLVAHLGEVPASER